ncbi:TerD family protein [Streptomyces sp. NPDC000594]|uniref:TerD family protein n=1 Tax=Streptomyces sp. NPDC000594 TaxID=3154261 RepID=UPI00333168ED
MSLRLSALDVSSLRDYAFDWALVDVETSGLIPRRDRVLSIAVVTLGPNGERIEEFSTLLNPGCDPGPVQVHGLTAERLRGAPTFDQIAGRIGALLQDRVLVAHNAQFDYDFLAHEFARARLFLPVSQRLCTLALNRQVDPPTADMRLGTLAAHYGVPQARAHDAVDDTRVLTGIFRATLQEAARLDLPLPLVACPPRQDSQFAPQPPKTPCAYRNPGQFEPGGALVQGMKIAITGDTATSRAELVARSVAAGLNMMTSVSRHTSVLITNEKASQSTKSRRAAAEGVPIIDEHAFLGLLDHVRPGTLHQAAAPKPVGRSVSGAALSAGRETTVPSPSRPEPAGTEPAIRPLAGRRVLVLGGTHPDAVAARTRIVELGGSAAVNLSRSVTDAVLLSGGESDSRISRITGLGLPLRDMHWLSNPTTAGDKAPGADRAGETQASRPQTPHVLPRGGVVNLPAPPPGTSSLPWHITATWAPQDHCEIDVVAFALDEDEQVTFDEDFIFYGAPENPAGTVHLFTGGPSEQTIAVEFASLPPSCHKVVVAAAIDGSVAFGDVGAVQVSVSLGTGAAPLARSTLDAATTERTLLLAEIYRRGPLWRFRAVGQGYDRGLDALARSYGVTISD